MLNLKVMHRKKRPAQRRYRVSETRYVAITKEYSPKSGADRWHIREWMAGRDRGRILRIVSRFAEARQFVRDLKSAHGPFHRGTMAFFPDNNARS